MNYSLSLVRSLEQMKKHANEETLIKIEQLSSMIEQIKPSSPFYPKNANMIELVNVEAFGLTGNASIFLMRNINGEVKEVSVKFVSTRSVNRQIENDIYELFIKECSVDTISSLRFGKTLSIGCLTHHTSGRANRDYELVSRYSLFAKRDPEQFAVFFASNLQKSNETSEDSINFSDSENSEM